MISLGAGRSDELARCRPAGLLINTFIVVRQDNTAHPKDVTVAERRNTHAKRSRKHASSMLTKMTKTGQQSCNDAPEVLNDGLINGDATLNGEMVTQQSCLMVKMVEW